MKNRFMVMLACLMLVFSVGCNKAEKPELGDKVELGVKESELSVKVLSAGEALKAAKESLVVVMENSVCTAGQESWNRFYEAVSKGKAASVLTAHYYSLDQERVSEEYYEAEKDNYPMLFFELLTYNGKEYRITSRKSTEEMPELTEVFACMIHDAGDTPSAQARYAKYDYYILVNDPRLTWQEIEHRLFSSWMPLEGDIDLRHHMVYTNYSD